MVSLESVQFGVCTQRALPTAGSSDGHRAGPVDTISQPCLRWNGSLDTSPTGSFRDTSYPRRRELLSCSLRDGVGDVINGVSHFGDGDSKMSLVFANAERRPRRNGNPASCAVH